MQRAVVAMLGLTLMLGGSALAAKVGEPAPDFTASDTQGKTIHLSDYKGHFVVLEWFNKDCPVSKGYYENHTFQNMEQKYSSQGVVWVSICSSAQGKQGFASAADINEVLAERKATPTEVVMDSTGAIGHLYDARTTPHMFVVNPQGMLIYNGAIDDHKGHNYVDQALAEAMAGKTVSVSATQSFGCSVKY